MAVHTAVTMDWSALCSGAVGLIYGCYLSSTTIKFPLGERFKWAKAISSLSAVSAFFTCVLGIFSSVTLGPHKLKAPLWSLLLVLFAYVPITSGWGIFYTRVSRNPSIKTSSPFTFLSAIGRPFYSIVALVFCVQYLAKTSWGGLVLELPKEDWLQVFGTPLLVSAAFHAPLLLPKRTADVGKEPSVFMAFVSTDVNPVAFAVSYYFAVATSIQHLKVTQGGGDAKAGGEPHLLDFLFVGVELHGLLIWVMLLASLACLVGLILARFCIVSAVVDKVSEDCILYGRPIFKVDSSGEWEIDTSSFCIEDLLCQCPLNTAELLSVDCNILAVDKDSDVQIAAAILLIFRALCGEEAGSSAELTALVLRVASAYRRNPFHNFHHAFCVLQFTAALLFKLPMNTQRSLPQKEIFALLLAAIYHDLDHPGTSDAFEIKTGGLLATRYNDLSPLENHHAAVGWRLMQSSQCDVLSRWTQAERQRARSIILECILHTDMAKHKEIVEELESRKGYDVTDPASRSALYRVLLHGADISNTMRPSEINRVLAISLSVEFGSIVKMEKELGMEPTPFMVLPDQKALARAEQNFIKFVGRPFWSAMARHVPSYGRLVDKCDANCEAWSTRM